MKLSTQFKTNCLKGFVAYLAMTILIVFAANDGGTKLSPFVIGLIVLLVGIGAAIVFIPLIIASATFDQFMIRNGAVDTDWYMFDSDPPGLADIKSQIKENQKNIKP